MILCVFRNDSRNSPYYTVLQEVEYMSGIFKKVLKKRLITVPHHILSHEGEDNDGGYYYKSRRFSSTEKAVEAIQKFKMVKDLPIPEDGVIITIDI